MLLTYLKFQGVRKIVAAINSAGRQSKSYYKEVTLILRNLKEDLDLSEGCETLSLFSGAAGAVACEATLSGKSAEEVHQTA